MRFAARTLSPARAPRALRAAPSASVRSAGGSAPCSAAGSAPRSAPRSALRGAAVGAAVVVAIALAGCSAAPTPVASPTAQSAGPAGPSASSLLRPEADDPLSKAVAQSETTRIADELQKSIDPERVLHVQNDARFEPREDTNGYYTVLLTISLKPDTDPIVVAQALATLLRDGGWSTYNSENTNGQYYSAMSSTEEDGGWFALIQGDATVAKQSVVTIKLASPDIS